MSETILKMQGIQKYFSGVHALKGVDFELRAGEVHALMGENGAGKSTLIKVLCGIHKRDGGSVEYFGENVEFANIVFALEKGKLTGPLPSSAGFTIVRVQEIRRATPPALTAPGVKARVEDSVRRKKSEERYREWIKRLRDKAVIRIYI